MKQVSEASVLSRRKFLKNSGLTGATRLREYPGSHEQNIAKAPAVFNYLRNIPATERIG